MNNTRICLWSSPRNISTAMMYSFAQRQDTIAFDEPLYAHYLRVTGVAHPGQEEILATQENDGNKVVKELMLTDFDKPVAFFKQMTHHLVALDESFLRQMKNILFIRDPKQIISSYAQVRPDVTMQDIGIAKQWELYNQLTEDNLHCVVLDSNEILKAPEKVLTDLCAAIDIPFDKAMLHWPAGPKKEDGCWAKYWYDNVHKSTGFERQSTSSRTLPDYLEPLYNESKKYYDQLFEHSYKSIIMLQPYNPKNENIQVFVKDKLYHRSEAKVSVFDSSVQGGDAVWEGLRVYDGKIFHLDKHIDRMHASAKTLAFADIPSREFIKDAIKQTLKANGMTTDTHIRLTLTRGEKVTSGMDPRLNQKGSCLIVLAEFKPPVFDNSKGIKLVTSHVRRNSPMHLDSKIHHNNLLNNILAKIEANYCGADAAIMLDNLGFVSETNDCNIFMVKKGTLLTPHADACLTGITRETTIKLAHELNIPCVERNISIGEFYNADEVFITGTMGELTPVYEIDGRVIENKPGSAIRATLYAAFKKLTETDGEPIEG